MKKAENVKCVPTEVVQKGKDTESKQGHPDPAAFISISCRGPQYLNSGRRDMRENRPGLERAPGSEQGWAVYVIQKHRKE